MGTTKSSTGNSATSALIIAVTLQNAAKLRAVKTACKKIFAPRSVDVVGTSVSDQPLSNQEAMKGAINQANSALDATEGAKYGVGLEGVVHQIGFCWFKDVRNNMDAMGLLTNGHVDRDVAYIKAVEQSEASTGANSHEANTLAERGGQSARRG
ncbi:hypothetical protein M427DRAFT_139122 [Gonapodya prolifera JEL478]|uniref:inosine/xanthosine triphosphatase n=1 Tax=Gonapodya prolifera (strain JEL478) TaxID=1344416 RepID=A0A139A2R7_GONPJ|nr:hypothetical protein M427DRAFT_139122 [Gonapodya prolifera JEL478]|eukprot:KXS10643.1 hypothetical protein M427DRAFT_139122 [Gonapodya prolifera JEL478]